MDLTIAAGAGLYIITCLVTDKVYIGQSECVLFWLGRHANELKKNYHTDCHKMQEDFNQHGLESFRFETLDVGDLPLNEKEYRLKR